MTLNLAKSAGVALIAVSGCLAASGAATAGDDPRLGKEVNNICFTRSIDGFRTLEGEDDVVLLEKGVNDWYRVELSGPCSFRNLRFAQAISIQSRPTGGCLSQGDTLVFHDSAFGRRDSFDTRCIVRDIYEWDEDALAEEEGDESEEGESDVEENN